MALWAMPCRADQLDVARKAIAEAQDEKALAKGLEASGSSFLKEHKYDEYVGFLKSLSRQDALGKSLIDYSIGRTRLLQLKHYEEGQQWEQYFNQGGPLRQEAVEALSNAQRIASGANAVTLYASLLLWQFHKDQQDSSQDESLERLVQAADAYEQGGTDPEPLKKAADLLAGYGEQAKARRMYAQYFSKISVGGMTDEKLFQTAQGFLGEGNLDLAEAAFDAYADKAAAYPADKAGPALIKAAKEFAYKDGKTGDTAYAEKLFARAESVAGIEIFDEDTFYARAFNLEAGEDFAAAEGIYAKLAARFPSGKYREIALLKAGIIRAYVKRDLVGARDAFTQLSSREPAGAFAVPALYQLGLFKQWEQDTEAAKALYAKARGLAGASAPETAASIQERLGEIEGAKPIAFALKTFLDNSLGAAGSQFDMSKAQIKVPALTVDKGDELAVSSSALPGQSGCSQVVLTYYWSGDMGSAAPGDDQSGFAAAYREPGVKTLNLVVMSATGVLDRALKMIDVK